MPKPERILKLVIEMKDRDLLVLVKANATQQSLEEAVDCLHKILLRVECVDVFCQAHELVKRNKITQRTVAIVRAISREELKPFHFLINKN